MADNLLEFAVLLNRMKTGLKVLAVIAVVIGLFLGVKAMKSRQSTQTEPGAEIQTPVTENPAPGTQHPLTSTTQPASGTPIPSDATPSTTPAVTDTNIIADWEQKIDDALASGKDEAETAKTILGMFPKMPPEGQISAAQHIVNLLADEDFGSFAGNLTNSAVSTDVHEIIFADLLNRPNKIKLPMLLEVARNGKPEQVTEAKDFLEVFVGEDFGTDWNLWQAKVQEWLKENPDEPTPESNGVPVSK